MAGIVKTVVGPIQPLLDGAKSRLNDLCKGLEPWQIVVYTCGGTVIAIAIKDFLNGEESLQVRSKRTFFKWMKKIPYVKKKIEEELEKNVKGMEKSLCHGTEGSAFVLKLPKEGLTEVELTKELERYRNLDKIPWEKGLVSGAVYSGDPVLTEVMTKAYSMFAWTNPLHPEVFPDVRKMEAEVVRMTCSMFNGGPQTCGTMSCGGTESILLACLAYRNMAREERGIKFGEIIVPVTAHAAFDKAAHLLHMKITHIPVDPETKKANVKAMKRAISRNTVMLVASAPGFPHGVIDPVEEIAALGKYYNIPVHVDSCLGGFLIPFMGKAGFPLSPFDFRVPGVTSISADTHKYGYAPKGSSVIMYKDKKYRSFQFFNQPDWPGGIYASPTLMGSRAGAIIAACWATMMYIGEDGYVDATRKIINATKYLEEKLHTINGIKVIGKPDVSVIAIGSDDFNIYRLSDALASKGWTLNPLQFPPSVHFCVTLLHTKEGVIDSFVNDVRTMTDDIMKVPDAKTGGAAVIYGMAQSIPDRTLVSELTRTFLDLCYDTSLTSVSTNGHSIPNGN
ncbi:sphingosine-1-phosphate lyase 1-like [Haliotis asinina]|uniref:sphingosine-1-phosphate lyase 1-like n=1 Tax=Haliotis asinina TaxID=109174 RepID=UPI003531ACF6